MDEQQNLIKAWVVVKQEAEIPPREAVRIACEMMGRRMGLIEGAYVDAKGWVAYYDRHEVRTVVVRPATDDDRAALRMMHLLRGGV